DSLDKSQRTANVISLLAHTSTNSISTGYVFGGNSGPLAFLVEASRENPRRELWALKESGEFVQPLWLVDDGLKHGSRSSMYFGEADGTTAFARALADEVISGQWSEVQIRQYDLGVSRESLLSSL